jgi:MoaA/NifB/PqqE/SkfB family radical SAM enzyme
MEALIAVTYRCNAQCHMCNIWKYPTEKTEEITVDDLQKIPGNLKFANITGGEPFIRDDIEELIFLVKSKTKRLVVSTNGYYWERIIEVAQKDKSIGFRVSLEGLPEANDRLRGIKNGFDRGLRTLLMLRSMGVKDIGFGITVSDGNAKDLMELYQLAKEMNMEFATAAVHNTYYFHKFDNQILNKEVAIAELQKLIAELLKSSRTKNWYRAYFNHGLVNYINGGKRLLPCEVGTNVFFMDPYGEIRPCNGMEESMGNIKKMSFDEIWQGEEAKRVRKLVTSCDKNCWMVGSAVPAMKKYITKPTLWILANKWKAYN